MCRIFLDQPQSLRSFSTVFHEPANFAWLSFSWMEPKCIFTWKNFDSSFKFFKFYDWLLNRNGPRGKKKERAWSGSNLGSKARDRKLGSHLKQQITGYTKAEVLENPESFFQSSLRHVSNGQSQAHKNLNLFVCSTALFKFNILS